MHLASTEAICQMPVFFWLNITCGWGGRSRRRLIQRIWLMCWKFVMRQLFPTHVWLQLVLTLPTTSCESERSFSQLKLIKTSHHSTITEDRLSALSLMKINQARLELCTSSNMAKLVQRYYQLHPRMKFTFLEWSLSFRSCHTDEKGIVIFIILHVLVYWQICM